MKNGEGRREGHEQERAKRKEIIWKELDFGEIDGEEVDEVLLMEVGENDWGEGRIVVEGLFQGGRFLLEGRMDWRKGRVVVVVVGGGGGVKWMFLQWFGTAATWDGDGGNSGGKRKDGGGDIVVEVSKRRM